MAVTTRGNNCHRIICKQPQISSFYRITLEWKCGGSAKEIKVSSFLNAKVIKKEWHLIEIERRGFKKEMAVQLCKGYKNKVKLLPMNMKLIELKLMVGISGWHYLLMIHGMENAYVVTTLSICNFPLILLELSMIIENNNSHNNNNNKIKYFHCNGNGVENIKELLLLFIKCQ